MLTVRLYFYLISFIVIIIIIIITYLFFGGGGTIGTYTFFYHLQSFTCFGEKF